MSVTRSELLHDVSKLLWQAQQATPELAEPCSVGGLWASADNEHGIGGSQRTLGRWSAVPGILLATTDPVTLRARAASKIMMTRRTSSSVLTVSSS